MCNLPNFKDGDTICFFGDSITASGLWMAEVYQELRKSFKIKCYNCGVSGATAHSSMSRLYSHCLIHNPHYVVIMFGINDISRELYADSCTNPDKEKLKAEAIAQYNQSYEWLISEIIAHGATPIMCIPIPYDDVSDVGTENLNCRKGLEDCAECIKQIHKKHGGYIINFNSVMTNMLGKDDIMWHDRVHPTHFGLHVMAQTFLHQLQIIDSPKYENPFIMEDWNQERYNAEKVFELINFVEHCALLEANKEGKLTLQEKKEIIENKLSNLSDKYIFQRKAYDAYLKNIDFKESLMSELVRLTI